MKIIETTNLSREGNDHYIYESVTLIEEFGMYSVITCRKDVGWSGYHSVNASKPTTDFNLAKRIYNDIKGDD